MNIWAVIREFRMAQTGEKGVNRAVGLICGKILLPTIDILLLYQIEMDRISVLIIIFHCSRKKRLP